MKGIDLFCSAGGSTTGMKMAGHKITDAYDINSDALDAYQENHPEVNIHQQDILELSAADLPKTDFILGSTPCKNFSQINMFTKDFDMTLTTHFLDLIKEYQKIKDIFWMCENVPTIKPYLKKGTLGKILMAADYGVPQKRKRWIGGNYKQPLKTHSKTPCGHLKPWVTFKHIKASDGGSPISRKGLEGAYRRANEMGRRKCNFNIHFIEDHDIVFTITSSEYHGIRAGSQVIYDNGILRKITFLECQRAQSFPDDYIFKGNLKERWRQLGDAVPPLMMKAIGDALNG